MKLIPLAFAALIIVIPKLVFGQATGQTTGDTFRASTLYAACTHSVKGTQQDNEFVEQSCVAYLRGLTDGLFIMQSLANQGTRTCMPTDEAIGVPEARAVFEAWLQGHPSSAANSAGLVAAFAIVNAHKCGG
jgi:Ssp1 endopeptidase immunity protein Rap1a